jgi:hypothetical protein
MPEKAKNRNEVVGDDFKQPQAGPWGEAQGYAETMHAAVRGHFQQLCNSERGRRKRFGARRGRET